MCFVTYKYTNQTLLIQLETNDIEPHFLIIYIFFRETTLFAMAVQSKLNFYLARKIVNILWFTLDTYLAVCLENNLESVVIFFVSFLNMAIMLYVQYQELCNDKHTCIMNDPPFVYEILPVNMVYMVWLIKVSLQLVGWPFSCRVWMSTFSNILNLYNFIIMFQIGMRCILKTSRAIILRFSNI